MEDNKSHWLLDPLSEPSRKARRNLMLSGGISLFLVAGKLMPTKISALGISIDSVQREMILFTLLSLTIYYFLKFYLYAYIDYENALRVIHNQYMDTDASNYNEFVDQSKQRGRVLREQLGGKGLALGILRVAFDFLLPLVIGVTGITINIRAF